MFTASIGLSIDLCQASLELASLWALNAELQRVSPYDPAGRPVLTIPGLLGDDRAIRRLSQFLRARGFAVAEWPLGRNLGPRNETFEAHLDTVVGQIRPRLRELADRTGAPVSLVGHSLGGVLARELGRRMPAEVDRILTLGAPVFGVGERDNAIIAHIGQRLRGATTYREMMAGNSYGHWDASGPDLPCVSIVSPIDRVVDRSLAAIPHECLDAAAGPIRENVVVRYSHAGLVANPFVQLVVADRLLADRQDWRRFDPGQYLPARPVRVIRHVYPRYRV